MSCVRRWYEFLVLHKHIINLELKVQHLYSTFKYEGFQVFMAVIMKNSLLGCDATSADRNLQPFWRYVLSGYSRFKSYHSHKSINLNPITSHHRAVLFAHSDSSGTVETT